MRLYQRDTLWSRVKGWLPAALFLGAVWNASDSVEEEQLRMAEESIRRAAVSCYAAEGSYPQNVEYLTEHYGVQLDTRKYVVITPLWVPIPCRISKWCRKAAAPGWILDFNGRRSGDLC